MKHLFRFIVTAGLFAAAAGCGKKPIQPAFSIVETDTLFTCGSEQFDVQYRFTSIANADADPALKAIEQANIRSFFGLEEFTGTAREALTEALNCLCREAESADLSTEKAGYSRENSEQSTSEAGVIDTLLVYTITSYSYAGGAHGIHRSTAHNYSLSGGYELTLGDLFNAAQRTALDTLIRRKLYDRFEVTDDEGLAEQGFFPEYIKATENFAVTTEGITFIYNPYDIACYAAGPVEVSVPQEELTSLPADEKQITN